MNKEQKYGWPEAMVDVVSTLVFGWVVFSISHCFMGH